MSDWHGVGVVGNGPRAWEGTGRARITRIATDGVRDGCSALYGALCRAAKALGYVEAWTETLPEEPGTSLRAAGFMDMGLGAGGEWDRPSRRRGAAEQPGPKRRWMRRLSDVAPWPSTAPKRVEAAKPVEIESAGPLFEAVPA